MDKLKLLEKLGGRLRKPDSPLSLKPAPNTDAVREAMERLRDPECRLLDEFLWFWPTQFGEGKTDQTLTVLDQGNLQAASNAWLQSEKNGEAGDVAKHNLAVLAHMLALDLEHSVQANGKPLEEKLAKRLDNYWANAFTRWRVLHRDDRFWDRLADRIRELDEPQLNDETAREMRTGLPVWLPYINAQLAISAAEQGKLHEAKRQVRIISRSRLDPTAINEALDLAVRPLRERIKLLCSTAEADATSDLAHANKVTQRLIRQTKPLLAILDCLLPIGHTTLEGAHDEVALRRSVARLRLGTRQKTGKSHTNWWKQSSQSR